MYQTASPVTEYREIRMLHPDEVISHQRGPHYSHEQGE